MALTTVLQVREKEKDYAQIAFNESKKRLEGILTELYSVLKKKETIEKEQAITLADKIPIDMLKEQQSYIESLNNKIIQLQRKYEQAKRELERKQIHLTEAHVEVKKFEKMIENRLIEEQKETRKLEQDLMDDLSIRQYLNQNR